jgi:uncharacterized metal-binding protein
MIESTKAGKLLVAIDGCPVGCAKKTLEHAGFNIGEYLQVTDLGMEKSHDLNLLDPDIEKVVQQVGSQISRRRGLL